MNKAKKHTVRNAEIELLRFIFATLIVLRHSGAIWDYDAVQYPFFIKGAFAVDFFFLLSGYLLMATVEKKGKKCVDSCALIIDTIRFLKRKISGFYTELIVANIIGLIILVLTTTEPLKEFFKNWILAFPADYLLLNMWIFSPSYNGPIWYLSTMLLCLAVLYPLLRKWPVLMSAYICPVISILLTGWLWYRYRSLMGPKIWIGFTYKGNIRGFTEICIGVSLFQAVKVLKTKDFSNFVRLLATCVKWVCYLLSFYWLIYASSSLLQLFILGFYILGIALTFCEKCLDYGIYQNTKVCLFLGRLSTSLYLVHYYVLYFYKYCVSEHFTWFKVVGCRGMVILYYCLAVMTALLVCAITYAVKHAGLYRRDEIIRG